MGANDSLGSCPVCDFKLCVLCREKWHPGEQCKSKQDKLQDLEQRIAEMGSYASSYIQVNGWVRGLTRHMEPCIKNTLLERAMNARA